MFAASLTVAVAACGGRGDPPPSPTTTLEPAVVSEIASANRDGSTYQTQLVEGTALSVDSTAARLTNGFGQVQAGDLLLARPGRPPTWWTALATKNVVHPSGAPSGASVPDGRCWYAAGGAYDEGASIHFSSGLLLPKAAGFTIVYDWIPDPFPTRDGDYFCVDGDGTVISLDFLWGPI
jgi:hypothetical protein